MATSLLTYSSILFIIGALCNIATNVQTREGGKLQGQHTNRYLISAWFYQIGCIGFVLMVYNFEKAAVELSELTNQRLVKWIIWGKPSFISLSLFTQLLKFFGSDFH